LILLGGIMRHLVSLDIETIPNLSESILESYKQEQINKVNNNKKITKQATRDSKIRDIEDNIFQFNAGNVNSDFAKTLIKDFSVDPLKNKICAIGLTYRDNDGELKTIGKAGDNEEDILIWMIEELRDFQLMVTKDIIFGGHYISTFDIASIKVAMIRNKISKAQIERIPFTRDTLFPNRKYSPIVVDLSNEFNNTSLNTISTALLGEQKVDDASKVYEYYLAKDFDRINEYCMDDTRKTYLNIELLNI